MIGTIQYVNKKSGQRGKYLTLALEDGTKGLVVNDETTMEGVKKEETIGTVKEGETYNFTVEKSGVFTIVTDIATVSDQDKPEKPATGDEPSPTKAKKPPGGKYHGEYMKRRVPEEQVSIARQAFGKALIEAYARLWVEDKISFEGGDDFNEQVRGDTEQYINWLEIEK